MPRKLAPRFVSVYELSAVALPIEDVPRSRVPDNEQLAEGLAALGYPGFSHLRRRIPSHRGQAGWIGAAARGRGWNPAQLLLTALQKSDLDTRVAEGLPWLLLQYADLDWGWVVSRAKMYDVQNRLGFVISLARRLAEKRQDHSDAEVLRGREAELHRSRLAREDTLCHQSITEVEKRWLRRHRPAAAREWNLLTDLRPDDLAHAC